MSRLRYDGRRCEINEYRMKMGLGYGIKMAW